MSQPVSTPTQSREMQWPSWHTSALSQTCPAHVSGTHASATHVWPWGQLVPQPEGGSTGGVTSVQAQRARKTTQNSISSSAG